MITDSLNPRFCRGLARHFKFPESNECFILVCQHCKGEKRVRKELYISTASTRWSDNRVEACDNSNISYVQRCPHCGWYYFADTAEARTGLGGDIHDGSMDVAELAAICSDSAFMESIEPGMKATLLMQYVHTYNDIYRRNFKCEHPAPYSQSRLFTEAVLFLTARCRIPQAVIADLYRQAGMFRKCLEYAATISSVTPHEKEIIDQTRYLAIHGETAPFVVRYES